MTVGPAGVAGATGAGAVVVGAGVVVVVSLAGVVVVVSVAAGVVVDVVSVAAGVVVDVVSLDGVDVDVVLPVGSVAANASCAVDIGTMSASADAAQIFFQRRRRSARDVGGVAERCARADERTKREPKVPAMMPCPASC